MEYKDKAAISPGRLHNQTQIAALSIHDELRCLAYNISLMFIPRTKP